jgi:uncharacterized membrane protein YjfL (UPF0719 family)
VIVSCIYFSRFLISINYILPRTIYLNCGEAGKQFFLGGKEPPIFKLDHELTSRDNKAFSISYAGLLIGLGFVLKGSLSKRFEDHLMTFYYSVIFTLLGMIFLLISRLVNEKLMMTEMFGRNEILKGNISYALIEGSMFIASGLVIGASLTGTLEAIEADLLAAILWFGLGQGCLVIWTKIYQWITPYDDQLCMKDLNHQAAGVGFGLTIIALGMLLANPISKGSDSLLAFTLSFVIGSVVLILMRVFVDRVILPGRPIDREIEEDNNWGAAYIEGAMAIAIALGYNTFLKRLVLCAGVIVIT